MQASVPDAGVKGGTKQRKIPALLELMLKGRGGQLLTENIGWSTLYLPELSHPKMCTGAVYTHFTELRTEF